VLFFRARKEGNMSLFVGRKTFQIKKTRILEKKHITPIFPKLENEKGRDMFFPKTWEFFI
jgi:hypothetical protein